MIKVTIEFEATDYDPVSDHHDSAPIGEKHVLTFERPTDQMNGPSYGTQQTRFDDLLARCSKNHGGVI